MRSLSAARKPRWPSSLKGTSGTRVKFTSWLATVAPAAMKPAWRPISFTSAMPFSTLRASVWARSQHLGGFLDGGEIAEGARHERHVVVDGLRDADHRQRVAALPGFLEQLVAAALRAVAADGEEDVHAAPDQVVHGEADVHRAARGAEHRAALLVDVVHELGRQHDRFRAAGGIQPLVAAAKAEHLLHAVGVVQFEEERADDVVQAGAQARRR